MAITNGYATLAEIKRRWMDSHTYTATTLAFVNAASKITDTAKALLRFQTGMLIEVSGSTSNDGTYTIATGDVAAEIVTTEPLTDEAAGDTVTITDVTDPVDDAIFESVVEAASRAIDIHCRRFFYTNAAQARYYTADDGKLLFLPDDLVSIDSSGLVTDDDGDRTHENIWATTDYILLPPNANTDSEPYTMIEVDPYGSYSFPVNVTRGVKITGTWGYAASVPVAIKEVCLLLAEQMVARKDAIYGVIGSPSGQAIMQMAQDILYSDPHMSMSLRGYKRFS
jgi:hypothetical protein